MLIHARNFPSILALWSALPRCSAVILAFALAGCSSTPAPEDGSGSSTTRADGAPGEQTSEPDPGKAASTTELAGGDDAARPASVFVVHQVPDFAAYVRQFEKNQGVRDKAGVSRAIVARLADDPQRVAVHFSIGSLGAVRSFLESQDYARLVEEDRATDSTLLWIATDELVELPAEILPGSVSLFEKFPARDRECLVRAFAAGQSELYAEGLLGFSLHSLTSDSGVSILHLLAADRANVERIASGAQLTGLLTGCGAKSPDKKLVANNYSKD